MLKLRVSLTLVLMVQLLFINQFIFSSDRSLLSPAADVNTNSKTEKCKNCWINTGIVGGIFTATAIIFASGTLIYLGPDIKNAATACTQGVNEVTEALPTLKDATSEVKDALPILEEAVKEYPVLYNTSQQFIQLFSQIQPFIAQIPMLEEAVEQLDVDVQTLIKNCTKKPHNKKKEIEYRLKLSKLKHEMKQWQAGVQSVQTKFTQQFDNKEKKYIVPKRSYQVNPIKLGKMARAQKNFNKSRR